VKAPRSWPNSSLSMRSLDRAAGSEAVGGGKVPALISRRGGRAVGDLVEGAIVRVRLHRARQRLEALLRPRLGTRFAQAA